MQLKKLDLARRQERRLNKSVRSKLFTGELQIKWRNLIIQLKTSAGGADIRLVDFEKSYNLAWLARRKYEYEVKKAVEKLEETLSGIYHLLLLRNLDERSPFWELATRPSTFGVMYQVSQSPEKIRPRNAVKVRRVKIHRHSLSL